MEDPRLVRKTKTPRVTTHTYSNRDTIDDEEPKQNLKPQPLITPEDLEKIKHPSVREEEKIRAVARCMEQEIASQKQVRIVRYALAAFIGTLALYTLIKYGRFLFSSVFWGTKSISQNAL